MANKNINDKLINIIVFIILITMICMIIVSAIAWERTNDLAFVISALLGVLGSLFNIYLFLRIKSQK